MVSKARPCCEIFRQKAATAFRRDWPWSLVAPNQTSISCGTHLFRDLTARRSRNIWRPKRKEFLRSEIWRFIPIASWAEGGGKPLGRTRGRKDLLPAQT